MQLIRDSRPWDQLTVEVELHMCIREARRVEAETQLDPDKIAAVVQDGIGRQGFLQKVLSEVPGRAAEIDGARMLPHSDKVRALHRDAVQVAAKRVFFVGRAGRTAAEESFQRRRELLRA